MLVGVGRVFVRGMCGMCFLVDESIGGVAEFCESSELSIV